MTWDVLVGYATGLYLVNPQMDPATLLPTVLLVHTCDAILCRIVAHNSGRSSERWTAIGFVGGLWAVMLLLLLPPLRQSRRP